MRAVIFIPGDPSVGINDGRIDVDFNGLDVNGGEGKDKTREILKQLGELFEDKVSVMFEDDFDFEEPV